MSTDRTVPDLVSLLLGDLRRAPEPSSVTPPLPLPTLPAVQARDVTMDLATIGDLDERQLTYDEFWSTPAGPDHDWLRRLRRGTRTTHRLTTSMRRRRWLFKRGASS